MTHATSGELAADLHAPAIAPEIVTAETQAPRSALDLPEIDTAASDNDEYWRREVAARLERYRSRRKPRAPKYPTLRLPFERAENYSSSTSFARPQAAELSSSTERAFAGGELHLAEEAAISISLPETPEPTPFPPQAAVAWTEPSNVIEFPRSAVIPVFHGSELAEPVLDRPRIVEAPEVVPPPPALGGILIGPSPKREAETPGKLAMPTASFARRGLANLIDALILATTLAGFAEIFRRINPARPAIPLLIGGAVVVAVMLWCIYEYLLVIYTGSTPGWRIARLRLVKFDGSPVGRGLRRWRVLASFLSAFALGLGYVWSVLDEDGLCWHDRITHTYLAAARNN